MKGYRIRQIIRHKNRLLGKPTKDVIRAFMFMELFNHRMKG